MKIFLQAFLSAILMIGIAGCEHISIPNIEDSIGNGKQSLVYGTTRTVNTSEISVPICIYAISGGTVKDSTSISSIDKRWEMTLGHGGWTISAMSGWPTWYGYQQITVDDDTDLSLILTPAVSQVDISLKGLAASKVSVELSGIYKSIKPTGAYSGSTTKSFELTKTDTAWIGSTYVYPTKGKLNITINADDTTYYYAYDEGLAAAYKYHFQGRYEQGRAVMGWITVGDWAGEKTINFNFGASGGDDILNLTMSSKVWDKVLSAYSDNPTQADSIASSYDEGGYSWRIPTKEEAKSLRNAHPDVTATDRYLCEGGTYTFSFNPNGSITKAGAKAEYKLVLVR